MDPIEDDIQPDLTLNRETVEFLRLLFPNYQENPKISAKLKENLFPAA
jgi:hypothetical protein